MTGILKVDQWKDSGDNALMTSDGAGNLNCNVNLGIGTSSPDGILHTTGSGDQIVTHEAAGEARLILKTTGTTDSTTLRFSDADAIAGSIVYTHGTNQMKFYTNGLSDTDMTIDSSGKMGIGTTSPTDLLDVRGSIKARDASDNVGRFHTRNAFTVTNGTAVQLTSVCGSAIVCVSCNTTGAGGLFWGTFSTSVSKLAGDGLTSDSGTSDIAVYKSSSSNLMYFKNRSGFSRDYVITVYAARHA